MNSSFMGGLRIELNYKGFIMIELAIGIFIGAFIMFVIMKMYVKKNK